MRLSTHMIVLLAILSFIGIVLLQVSWIRAAYEGEMSLYIEEKSQFETELRSRIGKDKYFKDRLKRILIVHNQSGSIALQEKNWFTVLYKNNVQRSSYTNAGRKINKFRNCLLHPFSER